MKRNGGGGHIIVRSSDGFYSGYPVLEENPDNIYTIPAAVLYEGGWEWDMSGFADWPKFMRKPKSEQIAWAKKFVGSGISEPVEVNVYDSGNVKFDDGHHRVMAGTLLGIEIPIKVRFRNFNQDRWPDLLKLLKAGYAPRDYNPQGWSLRRSGIPPLEVVEQGRSAADRWIISATQSSEVNKNPWSEKYKASIDCEHPKGFSQRAHCAGRLKRMRRNPELDYASLPIVVAEAMMIHGNNLPLEAWKNIYASIGGVGDPVEDVRNMNYDFIERVTKIQENLINESYLPPIPPRTLRITHSTGLRLANYGEEIVDLVKGILKHGLAPQAEGSGRHSELPTAVFALVDYPPNTKDNRLYNIHHPWVTADIPFEDLDNWYTRGMYSGDVVTLTHVAPEHIIAVNGLPKNQWRL